MIDQYSNYIIKEANATVDGVVSIKENMCDNTGIRHAYLAYGMYKCF